MEIDKLNSYKDTTVKHPNTSNLPANHIKHMLMTNHLFHRSYGFTITMNDHCLGKKSEASASFKILFLYSTKK